MNPPHQATPLDPVWVQLCTAGSIDPQKRMTARLAILGNPEAQDCTVYRPDETDLDAEEEDLGDAKVLFTGVFHAPDEWDEAERAEFFDDADPALFLNAFVECEAQPASKQFFMPEVGDYVAVMEQGAVVMFYVQDYFEDEHGRACVLFKDIEALD